ncbi:MAG: carboxypeptidase-like regulatory domain-containing protein [Caldilineaceae bacterium]
MLDGRAQRRTTVTDAQGGFHLADLAAGTYTVALEEVSIPPWPRKLRWTGKTRSAWTWCCLPYRLKRTEPKVGASMSSGLAPEAAGRLARLVDAVGNEYCSWLTSPGSFPL